MLTLSRSLWSLEPKVRMGAPKSKPFSPLQKQPPSSDVVLNGLPAVMLGIADLRI